MTVELIRPPQAEDHGTATRPVLADTALLRVNPLPGRRLGSPVLGVALRALAAAERTRHQVAERACDELYELAGGPAGPERHRALHLRRDIHNHRDPAPALLPGPWPEAVTAWLDAQQRSLLARTALTSGHEELLAHERTVLAELCAAEPFQLSLALNSPQVLDAVRRYRAGAAAPSARLRKSERGILQHLTRAMVRTSPLSRFTAVGFAHWSEDGTPLDAVGFDRKAARPYVSVDRSLFSTVVDGIAERPWAEGPRTSLPPVVARNRTLQPNDFEVRFVRRVRDAATVASTPLTRPLSVLLALTGLGPIRTAVLVRELERTLELSRQGAVRFVAGALEAQLLHTGPALDEQLADPLPAARAVLSERSPEAVRVLDSVSRNLAEVAGGGVAARRSALARLREDEAGLNALSWRPAQLHVNEDLVLPPAPVSARGYEQALDDLAEVTGFLALFDRHHEVRALLGTAFTDRFGPGGEADLLAAAPDLVAMVYRRETALTAGNAAEFGPADGSLRELLDLRAEALAHVTAAVEAAGDDPEAPLDPAVLGAFGRRLPDFFRDPAASYALLVQPADGRLVLNDCYGGRGLLGSRFLGPDRDLGGDAAERTAARTLRQLGGSGSAVLEDHGLHGSNINHHLGLLPDTITPEDWAGVRIAHDPATDRLVLRDRDGRPITPVSCGMKWSELLPEPLRIATWLSGSGRVTLDPLAAALARRPQPADGPPATLRLPRLTVGRVVLQRRRWYTGADFPEAAESRTEAEHLIALTSWRAAHDVPEEVVAKTPLGGLPSRHGAEGVSAYVKARRRDKPQYLDLGSALMARALPRLLDRRGRGYLEEALPGVRAARHALEWAVEFDFPAADVRPLSAAPTAPSAEEAVR
ncbi:lantibiotic dehydratase [Kitasatospora sp. NPDC088391]|uniref:lantibiotic dehydratase n=1 Tax=Kitasatospora sp. NPDC088391 TaxID=3364074 RepID=UPI0038302480